MCIKKWERHFFKDVGGIILGAMLPLLLHKIYNEIAFNKKKLIKFHSKMDFNSKGRISRFFYLLGNLYFYSKLVVLKLHAKKIRTSNFWLRLSYSLRSFFSWSHRERNYESSKIKTKFIDWLLRKNC